MEIIKRLQRKNQLNSIRRELQFWGVDTYHLSDDELEAKLTELHERMSAGLAAVTVTAQQAGESLRQFSQAAEALSQRRFYEK